MDLQEATDWIEGFIAHLPRGFEVEPFRHAYQEAYRACLGHGSRFREPVYRLRHGHRVARLGYRLLHEPELAGYHLPPNSDRVVWLAGVFHDVAKTGMGADPPGVDHAAEASELVRRCLTSHFDRTIIDRVAEAVFLHNKRDREAPVEARVVQDADLLDHFGALEVWLAAYASVAQGHSLEECLAYLTGPANRRWRAYAEGHAFFAVSRAVLKERLRTGDRIIQRLMEESAGELHCAPL